MNTRFSRFGSSLRRACLQLEGGTTRICTYPASICLWVREDLVSVERCPPVNVRSQTDSSLRVKMQLHSRSEFDRDVGPLTVRLFETEVQGRSFLVVLFLPHKPRHGTLRNSSKVAIGFVTSNGTPPEKRPEGPSRGYAGPCGGRSRSVPVTGT